MSIHPIIALPRLWIAALLLALLAACVQVALLMGYAGASLLPAIADGVLAVGLFAVLAYLSWFVIGLVSLVQTDLVVSVLAILFWLAGGFAVQQAVEQVMETAYAPFSVTFPFRLLAGVLCWTVVMLWYRLQALHISQVEAEDAAEERELRLECTSVAEAMEPSSAQQPSSSRPLAIDPLPEESIDRITVKDGSRIHLIPTHDLLYIQACGDYVTLVTPEGQYVKEQTMKYFETHLPTTGFVRIHRSTIVNVTQISRVELFGKENYRLLLKNGVKLRVSHSGYRLLKERLEL